MRNSNASHNGYPNIELDRIPKELTTRVFSIDSWYELVLDDGAVALPVLSVFNGTSSESQIEC